MVFYFAPPRIVFGFQEMFHCQSYPIAINFRFLPPRIQVKLMEKFNAKQDAVFDCCSVSTHSLIEEFKRRLNFSALPRIIQHSIIEKFNYNQMAVFDSCCFLSNSLVESNKLLTYPFHLKWVGIGITVGLMTVSANKDRYCSFYFPPSAQLSVDTLLVGGYLDNDMCDLLPKIIITCKTIQIQASIICSYSKFATLTQALKTSKVKTTYIETNLDVSVDDKVLDQLTVSETPGWPLRSLLTIKAKSFDFKFMIFSLQEIMDCIPELLKESYSHIKKIPLCVAEGYIAFIEKLIILATQYHVELMPPLFSHQKRSTQWKIRHEHSNYPFLKVNFVFGLTITRVNGPDDNE